MSYQQFAYFDLFSLIAFIIICGLVIYPVLQALGAVRCYRDLAEDKKKTACRIADQTSAIHRSLNNR